MNYMPVSSYMANLERPFGVWTATAMVVGTMIGAGIFVLPGQLAPLGWTGAVSWIVGGVGVMAIARIIADLTIQRSKEPSILTICGDILGLLPGRVIAWSYWVSIVCSMAVVAMAGAAYLLHLIPSLPQGPLEQAIGGTVIVTFLALINIRSVRNAGNFQVAATLLKLIPLTVVIGIVAWLAVSAPATYSQTPEAPFTAGLLTPALAITFFALLGFESAGLVAERVRDPARNVVRGTLLGLALVLVIYMIVSIGIMMASPADELYASPAPIAYFVARFLGSWAGDAVALFAAISAIGCINGLILFLGELPLGMVRDGQLPDYMAPTNSHDVAARPLLLGCLLTIALMLASVTGMGERVLDFLLRLTTASAIWFYAAICIAALLVRIQRSLAWVGLGFCVWVLYGTGLEAGGLGILLILVAVPLHLLIGGRTRARGTAPAG